MIAGSPSRPAAVLQALLVTFLWSTSWVLIKVGLSDLPPVTFAALRYGLASLLLWVFVLSGPGRRARLATLDGREVGRLAVLGATLYAVTQGAQFVALAGLPAATLSLVLGFTPTVVALLSWKAADEAPSGRQAPGVALALAGSALYFGGPSARLPLVGLTAALVALAANAGSALLGRRLLREDRDPLLVTTVSMTFGSLLLAAAAATEPTPTLDARSWAIVLWLATVNTAFAFVLWNRTLRRLTATESSVLNNTMAIQIPLLAWAALGETLSLRQVAGLGLAAVGAWWVQVRR